MIHFFGLATLKNPGQHFVIDLVSGPTLNKRRRAGVGRTRPADGVFPRLQKAESMTSALYRISKYRRVPADDVEYADTRWYEGQLVFAGPDAAIEVVGDTMKGYIEGKPSHPNGQLAAMIDNYDASILRGAEELRLADTAAVILAGKWHHVDADQDPRFEAYLVHVVSTDGTVITQRYASEIFDWDDGGYNNGGGFYAGGGPDISEDAANLQRHAELKLPAGKDTASSGLHTIEGVLWFPEEDPRLPIVYSNVNGPDAPPRSFGLENKDDHSNIYMQLADGTILGELRARAKALKTSPGEFRGAIVERTTHRPTEMTLTEVFSATDALGYWHQTRNGEDEPYMTFSLPDNSRYSGEVLKPVDSQTDKWAYGSAYASEWQPVGSAMPNYRSRVLAVGTIPAISHDPL